MLTTTLDIQPTAYPYLNFPRIERHLPHNVYATYKWGRILEWPSHIYVTLPRIFRISVFLDMSLGFVPFII
jgi:hypothetical protein